MHLADAFIQSNLHSYKHSGYNYFQYMCVPWELNPRPFALLTQRSTTETQEHRFQLCITGINYILKYITIENSYSKL